jgi:hypothetical protein
MELNVIHSRKRINVPEKKGNKINTFSGFEITSKESKEWWDSCKDEERKWHQEHIDFVRDHQKNIICGGVEKDHMYYEKLQAYMFKNPHEKLDTHICSLGEQSIGKSIAIGDLLQKFYGTNILIVKDINDLKPQFNAHLEERGRMW